MVIMKVIFGDLHLEGRQSDMASSKAARKGVEPEAITAKKVIVDRGQEEEAQVKEGQPRNILLPQRRRVLHLSSISLLHRGLHHDPATMPCCCLLGLPNG